MRAPMLLVAATASALVLAGCSSSSEPEATPSTTSTTSTTTEAAPTERPELDLTRFGALPEVPQPQTDTVSCAYPAEEPAAEAVQAPPTDGVDVFGNIDVTLATSVGPIGITLDRTQAPCTVNSVLSLAEQGYFDRSEERRVGKECLL